MARDSFISDSYDNADRLISLGNRRSDATVLASYAFPILDGNGNRVREVRDEPLEPAGLATETVPYIYNPQRNRLLTAGAETFTFDDEGQLFDQSGTAFTFDYEHRLIQAGTDQYFYDGVGNRLTAVRSGVTTQYVYDAAGNLLAEADAAHTLTRYYLHGLGLLAMVTPAGVSYSYHYDATGNTVAMTDGGQTVVSRYAYTPYGRIVGEVEAVPQPFRYVGQYGVMTEPSGFYYMRPGTTTRAWGGSSAKIPSGSREGMSICMRMWGGIP